MPPDLRCAGASVARFAVDDDGVERAARGAVDGADIVLGGLAEAEREVGETEGRDLIVILPFVLDRVDMFDAAAPPGGRGAASPFEDAPVRSHDALDEIDCRIAQPRQHPALGIGRPAMHQGVQPPAGEQAIRVAGQ